MIGSHPNTLPKVHNAMWPGLVGKGSDGAEPTIDLDTMLSLTAAAEVDGIKFDGVDIFLYDPHINIDIGDDDLKSVAGKIAAKGFVVGSVVAPVWFDASAMGDERQREIISSRSVRHAGSPKNCESWGVRFPMALSGSIPPPVLETGPRIPRAINRRSSRRSSRPP